MSSDIVLAAGEDALERVKTPEISSTTEEERLARQLQLRSPAAVPRPASRTPIGTPTPERQADMSHANSFSLCDLFSAQDRPSSAPLEGSPWRAPLEAPLEANLQQPLSPPLSLLPAAPLAPLPLPPPPLSQALSSLSLTSSPRKATSSAKDAFAESPQRGGGSNHHTISSPEMTTLHPQPRRLHQPLSSTLESEASLPLSPEPLSLEKVPTPQPVNKLELAPALSELARSGGEAQQRAATRGGGGGEKGEKAQQQQQQQHQHPSGGGSSSEEPYASTPSPGRGGGDSFSGFANSENWMESPPPHPGGHHRSVQNTPEPTHFYGGGLSGFRQHGGEGMPEYPLSTPSPSATPGGQGVASGNQAPYLGLPNRFPHGGGHGREHHATVAPLPGHGALPSSLSGGFSASSTMMPPMGSRTGMMTNNDAMTQMFQHAAGFSHQNPSWPMPVDSTDAAALAQAFKGQIPSHMQGQMSSMQSHMQGHMQNQMQSQMSMQPQIQGQFGFQQNYQQDFQQAGMRPMGNVPSWRMPGYPMPSGFPAPQVADGSSSAFGGISGAGHHHPGLPLSSSAAGIMPGMDSSSQVPSSIAKSHHAKQTLNLASAAESSADLMQNHGMGGSDPPPEVNELRGQVVQLSKTQAGSKYLQRQLLRGHVVAVEVILQEVEQEIAHLMCDAYGNYLCSVAFQACSVRQRKRMLEKLAPRVAAIACDKRGTHALQALIGLLTTADEQDMLTRAIKNHVIELSMDPNGTHVIQRLLFCFMPPFTDWIYCPVVANLLEVAHHPYGLCVLKKCIAQAKAPGKHQDLLLAQLSQHALDLVQSPYGNYAVQHALEEWGGATCACIFKSLEGSMMQLSIQKFSSNVVEKIFCAAPPEIRRKFIDELIESDKMSVLVSSNYGHYVVKRALQLADAQQVQALQDAIRGNLAQIQNRRLRSKWEKVMSTGAQSDGTDPMQPTIRKDLQPPRMPGELDEYEMKGGYGGGGGGGRGKGGGGGGGGWAQQQQQQQHHGGAGAHRKGGGGGNDWNSGMQQHQWQSWPGEQ